MRRIWLPTFLVEGRTSCFDYSIQQTKPVSEYAQARHMHFLASQTGELYSKLSRRARTHCWHVHLFARDPSGSPRKLSSCVTPPSFADWRVVQQH